MKKIQTYLMINIMTKVIPIEESELGEEDIFFRGHELSVDVID